MPNPKPGAPDLVFFQEVKPGDVLKHKGESNVNEAAGGGARDLRVPKQYGPFLDQIFTQAGGKTGVKVCTIHSEGAGGSVGNTQLELWRPTEARPAELRMARIGNVVAWGVDEAAYNADQAKGMKWFYLITKDSAGTVWARLVYEANLDGEDPRFRDYVRKRIKATKAEESVRGTIRWPSWQVDPQ